MRTFANESSGNDCSETWILEDNPQIRLVVSTLGKSLKNWFHRLGWVSWIREKGMSVLPTVTKPGN